MGGKDSHHKIFWSGNNSGNSNFVQIRVLLGIGYVNGCLQEKTNCQTLLVLKKLHFQLTSVVACKFYCWLCIEPYYAECAPLI